MAMAIRIYLVMKGQPFPEQNQDPLGPQPVPLLRPPTNTYQVVDIIALGPFDAEVIESRHENLAEGC